MEVVSILLALAATAWSDAAPYQEPYQHQYPNQHQYPHQLLQSVHVQVFSPDGVHGITVPHHQPLTKFNYGTRANPSDSNAPSFLVPSSSAAASAPSTSHGFGEFILRNLPYADSSAGRRHVLYYSPKVLIHHIPQVRREEIFSSPDSHSNTYDHIWNPDVVDNAVGVAEEESQLYPNNQIDTHENVHSDGLSEDPELTSINNGHENEKSSSLSGTYDFRNDISDSDVISDLTPDGNDVSKKTLHLNNVFTPIISQFRAQDEKGGYHFGYFGGPSSRAESRDHQGTVRGLYNVKDSPGNHRSYHYIADKDGFRISGPGVPEAQSLDDDSEQMLKEYFQTPVLKTVSSATRKDQTLRPLHYQLPEHSAIQSLRSDDNFNHFTQESEKATVKSVPSNNLFGYQGVQNAFYSIYKKPVVPSIASKPAENSGTESSGNSNSEEVNVESGVQSYTTLAVEPTEAVDSKYTVDVDIEMPQRPETGLDSYQSTTISQPITEPLTTFNPYSTESTTSGLTITEPLTSFNPYTTESTTNELPMPYLLVIKSTTTTEVTPDLGEHEPTTDDSYY